MRAFLIYLLVFIAIGHSEGQDVQLQKAKFAAVNIGFSGIIGGVGSLINKRPGEKPGKVLLKGMGQGSLGGVFQVLGKQMTYGIKSRKNLSIAWSARLTNSIGSSIVNNAMLNQNFWEELDFNLGLFRLNFNTENKKFKIRLLTSSIAPILLAGSQAKWDIKRTFQTGILIFKRETPLKVGKGYSNGFGFVSTIAYNSNLFTGDDIYGLIAHESMHILQFDNMNWLNPLFQKTHSKLMEHSNFYKKLNKVIYFDMNGLALLGLYSTQLNKAWECRFFEREADLFSNNRAFPHCH